MARTIYIRCVYGMFGRRSTKYTVKYGVYIRFWPTLYIYGAYTVFLAGKYGHIRCMYTVLAIPSVVYQRWKYMCSWSMCVCMSMCACVCLGACCTSVSWGVWMEACAGNHGM